EGPPDRGQSQGLPPQGDVANPRRQLQAWLDGARGSRWATLPARRRRAVLLRRQGRGSTGPARRDGRATGHRYREGAPAGPRGRRRLCANAAGRGREDAGAGWGEEDGPGLRPGLRRWPYRGDGGAKVWLQGRRLRP